MLYLEIFLVAFLSPLFSSGVVLGMEPRAMNFQGKCSTIDLHPHFLSVI